MQKRKIDFSQYTYKKLVLPIDMASENNEVYTKKYIVTLLELNEHLQWKLEDGKLVIQMSEISLNGLPYYYACI